MDIQYAARDRRDDLPPLDINDFGRQGGFSRPRGQPFSSGMSPAGASTPVAISGFSYHHHAPPPLPPPKFVPIDGQPFSEPDHSRRDAEEEDVPAYKRRVDKDEGYGSMFSSASTRSKYSAPVARFGVHHDRFQLRSSADAYDNSLLKKLDVRRTIDNRSPPRTGRGLSSSNRELPQPGSRVSLLQPLSLPTRTKQPVIHDPSSRLAEHGAPPMASPLSTPFGMSFHSARETNDPDEAGPRRFRRTGSILSTTDEAPASSPGSCMDIDEPDFSAEEPTRLRDFHIDSALARTSDHHHPTGQKRRASSPLCEPSPASHNVLPPNELFKRRDCPPRILPTASRLTAIPQGSECHMHPATTRSPYPSSLSLIASSISSLNSTTSYGDRRSPSALSPGGMSPTDTSSCASPFATTISLTASPGSVGTTTPHLRTISMEQPQSLVSPRKGAAEMAKPGMAKTHDYFMCECCPKKPKRFETAEELSTHEAEKQYECSFCGNRFKNKNEMERHQNSLHVRRHSWSCSALSGCERAFHESTATPGEADTCGYCGDDFTRSGHMVDPTTRAVSEHDWDERIRHLQEVHKFQECNSSKKFYRADHFRQHLKHSHAGTSGKWTNMLENACMLEEDPPLPKR